MKHFRWQILLGSLLIILSLLLYLIHYAVFEDLRHIFLWSMTSLAFLPISVLVVTLIINRLLIAREKRSKINKVNMVIETFFSEIGNRLLTVFAGADPNLEQIRERLIVSHNWSKQDFSAVSRRLKKYKYAVDIDKIDLVNLRDLLTAKVDFILRPLENPNLLEHEFFTELLRAVFRLKEELANREYLTQLPASDYEHLAGDVRRAYTFIVAQWLACMKYLRTEYSYLFSLGMRTNPFDKNASPVVK
jgi:hypothetical protein